MTEIRRRNRLSQGTKAESMKIRLSLPAKSSLREAAQSSGGLSVSLYLERLIHAFESNGGILPVMGPLKWDDTAPWQQCLK